MGIVLCVGSIAEGRAGVAARFSAACHIHVAFARNHCAGQNCGKQRDGGYPFYVLSFAQMLLPISAAAKGILWTILFGLAKTCQYGGLTILGVEGYQRLKSWLRRKKIGK